LIARLRLSDSFLLSGLATEGIQCLLMALTLFAVLLGCNSSSSPPKAKPAAKVPMATAEAPAEVAKAPSEPEPSAAESKLVEEAAPPIELPPARRIALLTPGGPLLVDVRLTLGGEPLDAAWTKLAAKAAADREKPDAEDESKESYDDASDESDEKSVIKPLVLRTSRAYVPDPRASSKVWTALDADSDGRLSADELAGAAERLWLRDANDDRTIAATELASLRDQLDGNEPGAMAGPRSAGPASARLAAIELGERVNLERLDFMLQDLYAPLQDLSANSFAALPRLFGQLDADGDNTVVRDELAALGTIPAVLDIQIDFPVTPTDEVRPSEEDGDEKSAEKELANEAKDENAKERKSTPLESPPRPTLTVVRADAELTLLPTTASDRIALTLGKTRLVISAHDLTPQGAVEPASAQPSTSERGPLEQSQIRLMVHDRGDALLDALDSNADGQLGEREIAAAPARLLERDADADGALSETEAPYQMAVAFLRNESQNAPPFSATPPAAAVNESEASVAPPYWFAAADLNGDGDVSRREFLGTAEQFSRLDADRDGFVDGPEAVAAPTASSSAPQTPSSVP
jgi:hypothetical protein